MIGYTDDKEGGSSTLNTVLYWIITIIYFCRATTLQFTSPNNAINDDKSSYLAGAIELEQF